MLILGGLCIITVELFSFCPLPFGWTRTWLDAVGEIVDTGGAGGGGGGGGADRCARPNQTAAGDALGKKEKKRRQCTHMHSKKEEEEEEEKKIYGQIMVRDRGGNYYPIPVGMRLTSKSQMCRASKCQKR